MGRPRQVDDGAGDGGLGDAQGDVAGVGGDAQGQAGAGLDDEGERAGPEALGEAVECGVDLAGEAVGLCGLADEQGERLVAGAGLELVDAVDGAQVDGIDGQAVEGVGGQRDDVAGGERADDRAISSGSGSSGWMRSISAVKWILLCEGLEAGMQWRTAQDHSITPTEVKLRKDVCRVRREEGYWGCAGHCSFSCSYTGSFSGGPEVLQPCRREFLPMSPTSTSSPKRRFRLPKRRTTSPKRRETTARLLLRRLLGVVLLAALGWFGWLTSRSTRLRSRTRRGRRTRSRSSARRSTADGRRRCCTRGWTTRWSCTASRWPRW